MPSLGTTSLPPPSRPSRGPHDGSRPPDAGLRQAVHRRQRRLRAGFGAILHQGDGPLAYFSRPFAARHLKLAAYEQKLIGLVQAVRHWRP
ncbi:hypothetical protein QYE76_016395 [Lolium multiflorum]|uniref:Reverse transcriptase RNase H-like domain-containing protein n=1 Tax=Lolium multiflorum TaxID=4521 RepID=A0AAD8VD80_LOLMU|nr:hypothetical protein QYE76_016395 [Lolium multiflorum]